MSTARDTSSSFMQDPIELDLISINSDNTKSQSKKRKSKEILNTEPKKRKTTKDNQPKVSSKASSEPRIDSGKSTGPIPATTPLVIDLVDDSDDDLSVGVKSTTKKRIPPNVPSLDEQHNRNGDEDSSFHIRGIVYSQSH